MKANVKFSFGNNWESYAAQSLNAERVNQARTDFAHLFEGIALRDKTLLDIGFGQGLSLLLAAEAGARVLGIDVDAQCERALRTTVIFFQLPLPPFEIVSILDDAWVEAQYARGGFDIVHSWGVLHHTGDMAHAFRNTARLVKSRGHLVIAIYNRHWTSSLWHLVKRVFVSSSPRIQRAMVRALELPMSVRVKMLNGGAASGNRGMELHHDVRDWLGGYPYEYASRAEIENEFAARHFRMLKCLPAQGWTGCNQFVFAREE